ncbi:glycogen synthase GlgA [Anaerobacillus isosaccharinicus]|uniref:Glycogen synthase n=1 Tax=Anaerobacillus isosaccharinicus TaxID=1532552 RepID=A0A1S2LAF9_9BACI|nr:glycogen synthase GlgA [Anaerobacillus isosaccharinicus]MBA5588095.1 glycogen synthase GlgA [Anaerobacillus isosaccharinicus]QOY33768.1 glycogen synthase GlgA [Anaerobacillus isosaccharinicus]
MKVLFVATECTPFIKTGGLADVIGALPKELKKEGVDVRVVLPKYDAINTSFQEEMNLVYTGTAPVGWRNQYVGVEMLVKDEITFYFIDNEYYFKRVGLYGFYDDAERFAYFNRAILEMLPQIDFQPDIIHCHDWQAALIPLFLKTHYCENLFYQEVKTMFTIHNLMYQGIFPKEVLSELLSLGDEHFEGVEFDGCVNFLKSALVHADLLTTVSETYAREIQNPYYGEKLDGLLRNRCNDLHGIVNGLDYKEYDPMNDPNLSFPYRSARGKKQKNKLELQRQLGLPEREDVPMLAIVTRLVEQKGLDLITHFLDELVQEDVQVIILGTGDDVYEQFFHQAALRYPEKVSTHITFNEGFARRIYAASDLFLMPSRFEPCGIGQLIALRYASVPIVRETGGLVDTVTPFNKETLQGNGFSFTSYNAHDFLFTIRLALTIYQDATLWSALMKNMTKSDNSWNRSARQYVDLYHSIAGGL